MQLTDLPRDILVNYLFRNLPLSDALSLRSVNSYLARIASCDVLRSKFNDRPDFLLPPIRAELLQEVSIDEIYFIMPLQDNLLAVDVNYRHILILDINKPVNQRIIRTLTVTQSEDVADYTTWNESCRLKQISDKRLLVRAYPGCLDIFDLSLPESSHKTTINDVTDPRIFEYPEQADMQDCVLLNNNYIAIFYRGHPKVNIYKVTTELELRSTITISQGNIIRSIHTLAENNLLIHSDGDLLVWNLSNLRKPSLRFHEDIKHTSLFHIVSNKRFIISDTKFNCRLYDVSLDGVVRRIATFNTDSINRIHVYCFNYQTDYFITTTGSREGNSIKLVELPSASNSKSSQYLFSSSLHPFNIKTSSYVLFSTLSICLNTRGVIIGTQDKKLVVGDLQFSQNKLYLNPLETTGAVPSLSFYTDYKEECRAAIMPDGKLIVKCKREDTKKQGLMFFEFPRKKLTVETKMSNPNINTPAHRP